MIESNILLNLLKKWNFWEVDFDTGVERSKYLDKLIPLMNRKEILVLKGIRRCGKSTILKQLMSKMVKQGIDKKQFLYLNLEDYRLKDSLNLNLFEFVLEVYKTNINLEKKIYFFIDEIQMIPEWERYLLTKYDLSENIKFIVSGSNASLLSKELSTLLTGRNLTYEISPLSYDEYVNFSLNPSLNEYLTYGGFPEVVLENNFEKKKKILEQYFEDIIYKDVVVRHNLRNAENVFNLARYLVENSATRISINKLSKILNMDAKSLDNYISAMVDAFLFIKINHFSYSLKNRFNKLIQPKYYVIDNGFFHINSLGFVNNDGKKFENIIANQLFKNNKDLTYWLDGNEVDFITRKEAINVTVAVKNIPLREFEGLLNFKKTHKEHDLILLTLFESYEKYEGIKIISYDEFKL